ncbi:beta-N-acetylhexosaminidase [Nereida sp. NH-UV-3]|uniref:beta-N-acetylhexosaminidase n=1 Tax=Nereida TaxID=282198 RepID=UPI0036F2E7F4
MSQGLVSHGAFILGCSGTELTQAEARFFREADPWGFILFARNVETPQQVQRLTAQLREAVGRDAIITVDQEGGRVQRLTAPHWRQWLPPLDQSAQVAENGKDTARAMYLRYRIIAAELRASGLDSNCAPMVDIATAQTHPFLRNRCYGEDLQTVVVLAQAATAGLSDGGVVPVAKHMPGHGRATVDSHKALPRVTETAQVLRREDFAAFAAVGDLPMAMTAHIVFEAFDEAPATTSPVMQKIIRDEIGFGGLLMTDDISMQALSGTVAARARASLDAGCDVVLHCNGDLAEMTDVAAASGLMTDKAALRATNAVESRRTPDEVDIAALEAEFNALLTS